MEKNIKIEKMERLNLILNALRDVGRLLSSENDREKLIKGICDILVEKRGYYNAWIGLFDGEQKVELVADSGFDSRFDAMKVQLEKQKFVRCIQGTMASDQVFSVHDPIKECTDCVLAQNYKDRGALAVRLTYEQINYGFMVLSTPRKLAMDEAEKTIIKEVADDIAVGLYRLDLEKKRERAERATQKSQIRFKTLIENSLNYISIIQNHSIVYKNPGVRKIHTIMEQVFEPPEFLNIYAGDRDRIKEKYQNLLADGITRIEADFRYYPSAESSEDAALRWALISATKIDYLGVESVLTNIMDVTNSMEVQQFLRIQDKMTSLGRVTAGIAHEIRNPLSGIYIYLKALKKIYNQMGDITKVVSIIDKIELASYKIESIIQRVMDFSKPGQPQFVMTDLNHYIDEVTKLTAVTLRKIGIHLVKELDPGIPKCFAEPHLIEQVILNLVTNAAEAMREFVGDKQICLSTKVSGDFIVICVTDTGPGIPLSCQAKIFDPFFTTKTNSSGIGLSICHRIILDHGGTLKLKSSKNNGAQFIIELPLDKRSEKQKGQEK